MIETQRTKRAKKTNCLKEKVCFLSAENFSTLVDTKKSGSIFFPFFASVVRSLCRHLHVNGRCAAVSSTEMRITLGVIFWRKIRREQKLCKHFRVFRSDEEKESTAKKDESKKKHNQRRNYIKHGKKCAE